MSARRATARAAVLATAAVLPAWGAAAVELPLDCRFTTMCAASEPCAPMDEEALAKVLASGDGGAMLVIEDDATEAVFVTGAGIEPFTLVAAVPGEGGVAMLSVFDDGTAALTMHMSLFGPFVATAHGRCEAGR